MFATIASGKVDLADVMFLVAVILSGVAAVLCVVKGATESALGWAGVACLCLGFLVL